jgi:SAM-dependent methyltransferase
MTADARQAHWEDAYAARGEAGVSWFEPRPDTSLGILAGIGATPASALIDIGGGASRLVDWLIAAHWTSVAVLDISSVALEIAKARLGERAKHVQWIVADVTRWQPPQPYDIWHDRAVFHFLIEPGDRAAYVDRLRRAVRPGGYAIIGTFAPDGPERCSGLPVMRYSPEALAAAIGPPFALVGKREHVHVTPAGVTQPFQFSLLRSGQPGQEISSLPKIAGASPCTK